MSSLMPWLAALVATLVAAAVLWPLQQPAGGTARRRAGFLAACASAGAAVACLYLLTGTPQAAVPPTAPVSAERTLREGITALEQSLAADPQRADGWALLGRSRAQLGQTGAAADAFARAVQLAPEDPGLLVEAAQSRAQSRPDKQFDDTALRWLQHALAVQPEGERAAWLLGIALRQRGRDAEAASVWSALLPRLQPAAAAALQEQIAVAQAAAPVSDAPDAARRADGLQVRIALPAGVATSRWPADSAVFVIARVPGGPPMPVAVRRLPLAALPATVTLTDADSPMPTGALSTHAEVDVQVRVSRTGTAMRGQGDLLSEPQRVRLPHERLVQVRWPAHSGP